MAKKINVVIGVTNKIAAGLKRARSRFKRFSRNVGQDIKKIGAGFRRLGTIVAITFTAIVRHGNQFRNQMAEVSTMLNDGSTALPRITKQVRDLSAAFGMAKKTLTEGLYDALSAGIPEDNAIEFLTVATKAAVGGVTDVKTAVDGLTTVMNAYGIEAGKAAAVSDVLFRIVKDGKINYEELSENIGKLAPTAKVAGVELRDLAAMVATLVKVEKPERAMTALSQAMIFAAKEGKPLLQILDEFEGFDLEQLLAAGVTKKAAAGMAIVVSNIETLRKEMKNFEKTAGFAEKAFQKMDAVRHWQKGWQSFLLLVSKTGERIDTVLGPAITKAATWIKNFGNSPAFDSFVGRVEDATKKLIDISNILLAGGPKAKELAANIGDVFVAALTLGGEKIAGILLRAAGDIGWAMLKGFTSAPAKAQEARGVFSVAQDITRTKFAKEGKDVDNKFGLFTAEFKQAVKEQQAEQIRLNKEAAPKQETQGTFSARVNLESAIDNLNSTIKANPFDVELEQWKQRVEQQRAARAAGAVAAETDLSGRQSGGGAIDGGITDSTSLISAGDIFTMMQTGQARETEITLLQQQNTTLVEIKDAIINSGVE